MRLNRLSKRFNLIELLVKAGFKLGKSLIKAGLKFSHV